MAVGCHRAVVVVVVVAGGKQERKLGQQNKFQKSRDRDGGVVMFSK